MIDIAFVVATVARICRNRREEIFIFHSSRKSGTNQPRNRLEAITYEEFNRLCLIILSRLVRLSRI